MLRGYCTTGMEKKQCLATQVFRHRDNALRHIRIFKSKPYPRALNTEIKKTKSICKKVHKIKTDGNERPSNLNSQIFKL